MKKGNASYIGMMGNFSRHRSMYITVAVFIILGIKYVSLSTRNVPVMDYWRDIVQLVPPAMNGKVSVGLLWEDYIGHRSPLLKILEIINIYFFSFNCRIESYLGILGLAAEGIVLYIVWNRIETASESDASPKWKRCIAPLIYVVLFNLNQWEILSLQFSFAFSIRLFLFLLVFMLLDNHLVYKKRGFSKIGILSGTVICTISSLYFAAWMLVIGIIFIFNIFYKREERTWYTANMFWYFCPCIAAIVLYLYDISYAGGGGGSQRFWNLVLSGDFFKGVLYVLAGSIINQSILETMQPLYIELIGGMLAAVVIVAVFLYFAVHMYKITYFPMMMCGYGLLTIPILIYGRASMFDLFYLTSSRYVCETNLIWVGCVFVFLYVIRTQYKRVSGILSAACLLLVVVAVIRADIVEFQIAPYRGAYKDDLIQLMRDSDIESKEDDVFNPFQSSPEIVKNGIKILKQYNLNIYASEGDISQINIGNTLETCKIERGVFEDGWIGPVAEVKIQTGEEGVIHLLGWYNQPLIGDETITASCNGKVVAEYRLSSENIEFDILCPQNTEVELLIKTNFSFQADPPDVRELAFILLELNTF